MCSSSSQRAHRLVNKRRGKNTRKPQLSNKTSTRPSRHPICVSYLDNLPGHTVRQHGSQKSRWRFRDHLVAHSRTARGSARREKEVKLRDTCHDIPSSRGCRVVGESEGRLRFRPRSVELDTAVMKSMVNNAINANFESAFAPDRKASHRRRVQREVEFFATDQASRGDAQMVQSSNDGFGRLSRVTDGAKAHLEN